MSRAIKREEALSPGLWLDFQDSKTWLQLGVAVIYLAVVYMVTPSGTITVNFPVKFELPWLVITEGMALVLMLTAIRAKFWVVVSPIALAIVFIFTRLTYGQHGFLYEGALTMLALISYITAAVVLVTNLFVKDKILTRLGLLAVMFGYCCNLSGWMVRWIEAGEKEGWQTEAAINGAWRYFPLDNLYPLTLGFCCGAALTTLVIMRRPKYQFLGALSLPIITVVLTLAMFLGNEYRTLPAVLDSYWRPIHVTIATVGYGVCLVSFGLAFAYLLKDGIRSEAIAIAVAVFGVVVYGFIGRVYGAALTFSVPLHQEYGASLLFSNGVGNDSHLMIRAKLPYIGPLMLIAFLAILASLALFIFYWIKENEAAKKWGWNFFRASVVLQAAVLVVLFVQIRNIDSQIRNVNPATMISEREYAPFGQWLVDEEYKRNNVRVELRKTFSQEELTEIGKNQIQSMGPGLKSSMQSNPVEFGGLVGLFVALAMAAIFSWKRKDVVTTMPGLEKIDSMLYRTVGVAFPLLSMLLITGAVWANESWGRYWGWDSKEVGALVAWMAYAGFLHTRIAHGWRGRRSAYFALLGFALVIFTWLGVSYLLPGLHSYA